MFIKVNVRQDVSGKIVERRLNTRYITHYWQGSEDGTVMMNHDHTTYKVVADIDYIDALLDAK